VCYSLSWWIADRYSNCNNCFNYCFSNKLPKGIEFRKKKAEAKIGSAEQEAERIISEAQKIAEAKKGKYCLRQRKRFIKAGWSSIEKLRKEEMKSSVWREDLFKGRGS